MNKEIREEYIKDKYTPTLEELEEYDRNDPQKLIPDIKDELADEQPERMAERLAEENNK